MATSKRTQKQRPAARPASSAKDVSAETVDPVWLIRALALSFAAALVCAYLTACLLFYQGAWQLILHPSRAVDRTPAAIGLAFTPVRFGDFNAGVPHLTGWWVPAQNLPVPSAPAQPASMPRHPALTILYLHGGSGSLSNTLPVLAALHNARLNVFAIDYRGFGASDASSHPDADRMAQDAAAALDYLVTTRHLAPTSIIPMGTGLGASLVVQLAQDNPRLSALVLDNPDPDPAATAAASRPSRIIPIRLLFGRRYAIAGSLSRLPMPKLLIAGGPSANPNPPAASLQALFRHAAEPRCVVTLSAHSEGPALRDALQSFLDRYLPGAR